MSRMDLVRDTDPCSGGCSTTWTRRRAACDGSGAVHTGVPTRPVHMKNSYTSETPVTDGERVYVYLSYVGLFAYDMQGTQVWAKPMEAKNTGTAGYFYGGAASPALHGGRLYIVNDNEEESFIAAFDARTGAEVWRAAREEESNWSTPYVWQNDRRTEIVSVGSHKVQVVRR